MEVPCISPSIVLSDDDVEWETPWVLALCAPAALDCMAPLDAIIISGMPPHPVAGTIIEVDADNPSASIELPPSLSDSDELSLSE